MGDNETVIEGPVLPENILGVAINIIRNNKEISCQQKGYRYLSELWITLRPMRPVLVRLRRFIHRKFHI